MGAGNLHIAASPEVRTRRMGHAARRLERDLISNGLLSVRWDEPEC
jgi:hypothetical protein